MVESIKHCIVLLQIAKSTINPIDAIHQPSPLEPVINTMPSQTVLPPGMVFGKMFHRFSAEKKNVTCMTVIIILEGFFFFFSK